MNRVDRVVSGKDGGDFSARAAIARAHKTCTVCEKPAVFFYSKHAEAEYRRTLVCQSCQGHLLTQAKDAAYRE